MDFCSPNVTAFLFIYLIWFAWFFVVLLAKRYFAGKFLTFWNISAIMAHLLDAAGTFVSMTYYGFTEKHVLGRVMIEFLEGELKIVDIDDWYFLELNLQISLRNQANA